MRRGGRGGAAHASVAACQALKEAHQSMGSISAFGPAAARIIGVQIGASFAAVAPI